MKKLVGPALLAGAVLLAMPLQALAFDETCHNPLSATGHKAHTQRGAMFKAAHAWAEKASDKYGDAFGHWHYSGDRTFDCKWTEDARKFKCVATARPCGPR
ncbi:MAG: hypothetical protein JSS20_09570 [Proteobacteria bacterium]|nr:hypothetical protein [Pseudomonadota bacterium]